MSAATAVESLRRSSAFFALLIAYVTVRPEAIFILTGFFTVMILAYWRGGELAAAKRDVAALALTCAWFALLAGWRWYYFDNFFPEPVSAKMGGGYAWSERLRNGFGYCRTTVTQYPVIILLALPILCRWRRPRQALDTIRSVFPLFAFCAVYLAFVITSGGDWMWGGRFFVPIWGLGLILFLRCFESLAWRQTWLRGMVVANLMALVYFARVYSSSTPLGFDSFKQNLPTSLANYNFFEYQNRMHYSDLLFINAVRPVLAAYMDAYKDREFSVMSVQAGMIPYHLFEPHHGRIKFLDPVGLSSRDFSRCPVTHEWGHNAHGLVFSYKTYFKFRDRLEGECRIPRPDFIFEPEGNSAGVKRLVGENGYTVVYQQTGTIHGRWPFDQSRVEFNQFFSVRNDLFQAHPVEIKSLSAPQ